MRHFTSLSQMHRSDCGVAALGLCWSVDCACSAALHNVRVHCTHCGIQCQRWPARLCPSCFELVNRMVDVGAVGLPSCLFFSASALPRLKRRHRPHCSGLPQKRRPGAMQRMHRPQQKRRAWQCRQLQSRQRRPKQPHRTRLPPVTPLLLPQLIRLRLSIKQRPWR